MKMVYYFSFLHTLYFEWMMRSDRSFDLNFYTLGCFHVRLYKSLCNTWVSLPVSKPVHWLSYELCRYAWIGNKSDSYQLFWICNMNWWMVLYCWIKLFIFVCLMLPFGIVCVMLCKVGTVKSTLEFNISDLW